VLFAPGTNATLQMADVSTVPVSTLHIRATEYSVGDAGPDAMPERLPPQSGYTYAVELEADEALAVGAKHVAFSQPVVFYLENFLGFATGEIVPVGSYDRVGGCWVPEPNGRVVKVLSETGGLADLDIDGDGLAEGLSALTALGITDTERAQVAALYDPGQSVWRVPLGHLSAIDCNAAVPTPGCKTGSPGCPPAPKGPANPDSCSDPPPNNSTIACQNQTLGESTPIAGTPYSLFYSSDRVPGYRRAYALNIPLTGATVPADVSRADFSVSS
jgi:hypothetical protein